MKTTRQSGRSHDWAGTVMTGAVLAFLAALVSGTRLTPFRKLKQSEYFEEHCSHSQKKTVARDGFRLQIAFGTSAHGVLGDAMSKR